MDPEVSALIATYQKRLREVTDQAVAFEARIQVLTMQLNQFAAQQQQQQQPLPEPAKKTRAKKTTDATDAGSF